MKTATTYLLLFLYVFVQVKPLAVVLQDSIAHTFFAMQHMATVHYENGQFHVHKELKAIDEQDRNNGTQKNTPAQKTTENTSPQNITQLYLELYSPVAEHVYAPAFGPRLSTGFTMDNFRPPSLG